VNTARGDNGVEEDSVQDEGALTQADAATLATLRAMWSERDPVPPDLADRVLFVLSMEDLEAELLLLSCEQVDAVGARGEDQARTITFSNDHLSVMVTISDETSRVRLDGWIGDGGGVHVGLRHMGSNGTPPAASEQATTADHNGRFAFPGLGHGLVQLVFHPTDGAQMTLPRAVVTPAVQI
jgi:hypothetical protein